MAHEKTDILDEEILKSSIVSVTIDYMGGCNFKIVICNHEMTIIDHNFNIAIAEDDQYVVNQLSE